MHTCFHPQLEEGICTLTEQEAAHVSRVLRRKEGEEVRLIDGQGAVAIGTLMEVGRKKVTVAVRSVSRQKVRPRGLVLVVSPTKSSERFEWLLEKATELGVESIIPIWTHRSTRRTAKHERWSKVIQAATKQCLRTWMPVLHPACSLEELTRIHPWLEDRPGAVAHCMETLPNVHVRTPWVQWQADKEVAWLAIGPEGDFEPAEVEALTKQGATPVLLGSLRLRTETAGMAAVAQFLTQDDLGSQDRVVT